MKIPFCNDIKLFNIENKNILNIQKKFVLNINIIFKDT